MSESIRTPSVWSLPLHTLRLAGRCVLPLVMWYAAGRLVRFGLLVGGTELAHGSMRELRLALTMLVFIVMVMANLVVSVGMFHALRGSLWEIRARRADGDGDEGFTASLGRVIIPFVALYLAWGWHLEDVRDYLNMDIQRQSDDKGVFGAFYDLTTGNGVDTARILTDLSFTTTLTIMGVAFVGGYLFTLWYEHNESRFAAMAAAFCNLAVFYYGAQVVASRADWVGGRLAWTWWHDLLDGLALHVPGLAVLGGLVEAVKPYAWDALVLPAAWLTVAILMYGAYAEDAGGVIKGTRLEGVATQAGAMLTERTHSLTRRSLARFAGRWADWVPLLHTVRLTVRGGAPLFGYFALCFVGLQVGRDYAWRGLVYLIGGDHPRAYFNVLAVPLDFAVELVFTVLTTCLLAATFDVAAGAERRRRAAAAASEASAADGAAAVPASGRSEEPGRSPGRRRSRSATAPALPRRPLPSGPNSPG
ncbi:hypothetical protein Sme01_57580 [Sphaerisporangium melleum]|uniref:Uncharacterized protein n=1 Tax=Sphaerisporangium melleum TaxID=321316 RepID=A0A917VKQ0_9ACTN|nr:hypothetical protein [Sphaerisporangium melleum]GGK94859.1 hypothetical protein GCM10007964_41460 [Sphaerisporangium melleum]GII73282.1 hypothetical protein Sme01_57580 [Sphaerisporangium melleum]